MYRFLPVALIAIMATLQSASAETLSNPQSFDLSAYRGKVVYLDFWASWCGPCKLSFPFMNDLARRFQSEGLVIITDNLDHDRDKAQSFLQAVNARVPVMFDRQGILATRFHVDDMPTSVLIDRHGTVRYVHKGFFQDKEDEYMAQVLKLLREQPGSEDSPS